MTRPLDAGRAFVASLPTSVLSQVTVIETPLLRITPTGRSVDLGAEDAAIFTSANGVRFAPDGAGRRAFCVGAATTRTAKDRGWTAVKSGETAEQLVVEMMSNPPDQRLFHLAGIHTRGNVAARLQAAGAQVEHVALYDQDRCTLTQAAHAALGRPGPTLVPLFSPRTAVQFFDAALDVRQARVLALSDAIADCAPELLRKDVVVSKAPTASAMVKALVTTIDQLAAG
ncbi:MAG: uroporphyrinogen-III synthase [Pseudomonadota bacterium]